MKSKHCPLDLLVVSVVFPDDTSTETEREESITKPGCDSQGLPSLISAGPKIVSR